MEKTNLDVIFSRIESQLRTNLAESELGILKDHGDGDEGDLRGTGTIPFTIKIDQNGNGEYNISKYGAGVTLKFDAIIDEPKGAKFNISLKCSKGGGGAWHDIATGSKFSGVIKTSFWGSSNIKISINSTVPNCTLKAKLSYRY